MVYTLIIVDAIKLLYEGTKVMTPDGETEWFDINTGVLR